MKTIKLLSILLVALVAMGSCSKDDDDTPDISDKVKVQILGTWYTEYLASGTINGKSYKGVSEVYQFTEVPGVGTWNRLFFAEADSEDPIDDLGGGSGATGMFTYTVDRDGTIRLKLSNLDLATYDLSYYAPTERALKLDADAEQLIATGVNGQEIKLVQADELIMSVLSEWAEYLHGGADYDDSKVDTGISDKDADEPSRAPMFM